MPHRMSEDGEIDQARITQLVCMNVLSCNFQTCLQKGVMVQAWVSESHIWTAQKRCALAHECHDCRSSLTM